MSLVLDTSATLAWLLAEPAAGIDAVLDQVVDHGAVVPSIWRYEVVNALMTSLKRQRIDDAFRGKALDRLADLPIAIDGESTDRAWTTTLMFAASHHLTIYDAAFLELAQRLELPLATLDKRLAQAAHQAGIPLLL